MSWFGVGRRWFFVPEHDDQCQARNLEVGFRLAFRAVFFCTRWCVQRSKSKQQLVNLGWNSDSVNVHVDALWKALNMKVRTPVKVMEKMALCPAT